MAQYVASIDGRTEEVKISAHERENGGEKKGVCVCVALQMSERLGPIQCHVSVYLFQLSACSLRGTHSRKVAAG